MSGLRTNSEPALPTVGTKYHQQNLLRVRSEGSHCAFRGVVPVVPSRDSLPKGAYVCGRAPRLWAANASPQSLAQTRESVGPWLPIGGWNVTWTAGMTDAACVGEGRLRLHARAGPSRVPPPATVPKGSASKH